MDVLNPPSQKVAVSSEGQILKADLDQFQHTSNGEKPVAMIHNEDAAMQQNRGSQDGEEELSSTAMSMREGRLKEEQQILDQRHELTRQLEISQQQGSIENFKQSGIDALTPGRVDVPPPGAIKLDISVEESAALVNATGVAAGTTAPHAPQQKKDVVFPDATVNAAPVEMSLAPQPHISGNLPGPMTKAEEAKPKKGRKKDTKWLGTLDELKDYKATFGNCIVPRGYSQNPRLASWVAEQRKQFKLMHDGKQSSITNERIALLSEMDFAWNAQEAAWTRHMHDLKKFRAENGHCHVPLNHPEYPRLGLWVKEQRRHYTLMKQDKQSHMTKERMQDLNSVNFCWDTHEASWRERLRELADFKQEHGSCIVPTNYASNRKLGTWVHHQRRQHKKFREGKACHITEERIKALNDLGFTWYPRNKGGSGTEEEESAPDGVSPESETNVTKDLRPSKRIRKV